MKLPPPVDDEVGRENIRLARRVKRLEATLEQTERIGDANAGVLRRVMDELDAERQHSRELLLNVLPARIVARLDAGETNIADRHDSVAVLMSDLVDFTASAAELTASELVDELNTLFIAFDEACAARGVEKIKTIGDAYMAVAGLDGDAAAAADQAARGAVELALDMFASLQSSGSRWNMRIGIHAGPVVAGMIGQRKFAYDVWGDTVNVASRLETSSPAGRIQVSSAVASLLGERFVLEPRGEIELKGKGPLPTWLVVGRREGPPL